MVRRTDGDVKCSETALRKSPINTSARNYYYYLYITICILIFENSRIWHNGFGLGKVSIKGEKWKRVTFSKKIPKGGSEL
jgi:hypothetical protein